MRRVGADVAGEGLAGAFLVVVAPDVPDHDAARIASSARAAHALVYAVDRPALSDLALPAVVDRGLLSVAISTSGASPLLASRLREALEPLLPLELGALAEAMAALREALADHPREARVALLEQALEGVELVGSTGKG